MYSAGGVAPNFPEIHCHDFCIKNVILLTALKEQQKKKKY
jgi:hypothetical protein